MRLNTSCSVLNEKRKLMEFAVFHCSTQIYETFERASAMHSKNFFLSVVCFQLTITSFVSSFSRRLQMITFVRNRKSTEINLFVSFTLERRFAMSSLALSALRLLSYLTNFGFSFTNETEDEQVIRLPDYELMIISNGGVNRRAILSASLDSLPPFAPNKAIKWIKSAMKRSKLFACLRFSILRMTHLSLANFTRRWTSRIHSVWDRETVLSLGSFEVNWI